MSKSYFYVVTDDQMVAMRARQFAESCGAEARVYSTAEWNRQQGGNVTSMNVPSLSSGVDVVNPTSPQPSQEYVGGKVLPFPGPQASTSSSGNVETINDLESKAIEQAIHVYRGNLTEAAKALGIGRATLYRKVKQYNIDTQAARRRKVA